MYVRKYRRSIPIGCMFRDTYPNIYIVSLTCFLPILVPVVKNVINFLSPKMTTFIGLVASSFVPEKNDGFNFLPFMFVI